VDGAVHAVALAEFFVIIARMKTDSKPIMKALICRRQQKARWIFIVASLPLFLFALMGLQYGAFFVYFGLGIICLWQVFYPTLIGWAFILLVFMGGASLYLIETVKDIIKIVSGERPNIFVDFDDSMFFGIVILLILVVAVVLIKAKPVRFKTE
jgi:hypothetical protein